LRQIEEQDIDAPMEASMTQGSVTRGARKRLYRINRAQLERAGPLPSSEADMEAIRNLEEWDKNEDEWERLRKAGEEWRHPGNKIAKGSKLMDVWYLDDGTIVCHPAQAANFLEAFDVSCEAAGARRSRPKTKVTLLASKQEVAREAGAWELENLKKLATAQVEPDSLVALGAETLGPEQAAN